MCGLSIKAKAAQKRVRAPQSDGGIYLPLLASGLLGLVIIVGVAIDTARLYRVKIELQQAVDAAAIASSRLVVNSPSVTLSGDASRVYSDSLQIVGGNLLAAGYSADAVLDMRDRQNGQGIDACIGPNNSCCFVPGQPFVCSLSSSEERRFIEISARFRLPTLIVGGLPGFSGSNLVSARGVVENLRMQTVLVLDRSGSMDDEWEGSVKKGDFLKTAAKAFIDTLLPFDELGIVSFSATTDTTAPAMANFEPLNDSANLALLRGNYANDSAKLYPTGNIGLIQIGSGNTVKNAAKAAIDTLAFSGNTDIGSGIWRAKTILDGGAAGNSNILRLIIVVTDGTPYGTANNYLPITWWSMGERPRNAQNCGGHPLWSVLESPCPLSSGQMATCQNNRRQRLRMLDAIIESDLAREAGYVVFTVGAGEEDGSLAAPFQNISALSSLKRFLLRRVANDQAAMRLTTPYPNPNNFVPPDPAYPWDFPCVPSGAQLATKPRGQYLLANSGQELIDAFREIANVRSRFQR
ncbi:MAG: von Willebrand factor type domain [Pseudomonadota bacterium]|jgi:hypothetical protein